MEPYGILSLPAIFVVFFFLFPICPVLCQVLLSTGTVQCAIVTSSKEVVIVYSSSLLQVSLKNRFVTNTCWSVVKRRKFFLVSSHSSHSEHHSSHHVVHYLLWVTPIIPYNEFPYLSIEYVQRKES